MPEGRKIPEARKMLAGGDADSHKSTARCVGQVLQGGFELELEISNNYCIYRWGVFSLSNTRLSNS